MPYAEKQLHDLLERLELVCGRMEQSQQSNGSGRITEDRGSHISFTDIMNGDSQESHSVQQFDQMVMEPLDTYKDLSHKIGGHVGQQADIVVQSFNALRDILKLASHSKTPTDDNLQHIMQPIVDKVTQITELTEKNRADPLFNNLSVISSSIPALGWIGVKKTPAPYIKEMLDAGTFYANKIMMEHKGESSQADWIKSWNEVLTNMFEYVKKFNTTGLVWNEKGQEAKAAPAKTTPGKTSGTQGTAALRKVPDSEKNNKNKDLKASGRVPAESKGPSSPTGGKGAGLSLEEQIKDKKPNTQLQGNKWVVEYHLNNAKIEIKAEEIKQAVYMYKCVNSTIVVKGKLNGISIDNCKKCSLVFDSIIGQLEITNSQSTQAQVMQKCPLMAIENCDGAQVYLSKDSLDVQVITAKSTAVNLLVPTDEAGDYKEFPVPEQYKTVWEKDKFVTTAVEKKG